MGNTERVTSARIELDLGLLPEYVVPYVGHRAKPQVKAEQKHGRPT